MFFANAISTDVILDWVALQISAIRPNVKYGFDVIITPHKKTRTTQQNRFLMAVMQNIVRFYDATGFIPSGLSPWMMRTDILKEFYKARFGVGATHKLSTKEFGEFIDKIQFSMVEETGGEYEVISPEQIFTTEGWNL